MWLLSWDPAEPAPVVEGAPVTRLPDGSFHLVEGIAHGLDPARPLAESYDRARGGFLAVRWDAPRRRLEVARDPAGVVSAFHAKDGPRILVSSLVAAIHRRLPKRPDRLVLAEHLQSTRPDAQVRGTFFEGISRLPPAHLATFSPALEERRLWDPLPRGFEWAAEAEAARFVEVLRGAVARDLDAGVDCIALSAGFDSVSIAALAADLRGSRPPLEAVSVLFPHPGCDESGPQRAVAAALGLPQSFSTVGPGVLGDSLAFSSSFPMPVLSPWQSVFTSLLRDLAARGRRNLFMGTGGDEMLVVDERWAEDLLRAGDLQGLWAFYRTWRRSAAFPAWIIAKTVFWDGAIRPLLGKGARKLLPPRPRRRHPWLPDDPELHARLAERSRPAEPDPDGAYVGSIRRLLQSPALLQEFDTGHAWGESLGLREFLPYFDRDVMELSLRMRPEHLLVGGKAKGPLRNYVATRLPGLELPRRKVDFTGMVHRALRSEGPAIWRRLGGPERLAALGAGDGGKIRKGMADYFEGRDNHWKRTWTALSAEAWLAAI